MKKICVVTGTRAEYGLLRWVMEGIRKSTTLDLQLIVTGAHLSPEFGLTVNAIEEDGLHADRKVEILLSSDTGVGISKTMGLGIIGFADALDQLRPDLLLVLGDRYEIFSAVTVAMLNRIPIAHLHGGETTEGVIDEAIRHSITKMSHLHFVATEDYRQRVVQLGEEPERVFNVGGLGVDSILRLKLLSREELEGALDFKFQTRNLLITFHPVTLEENTSAKQMDELLSALSTCQETGLIFTMPNADLEGRILFQKIKDFCSLHSHAKAYTSLGQLRYFSCIQHVDGVVGNSSSGITEVPSFKKGTINIGERQLGRLRSTSVIDCRPDRMAISAALSHLESVEFQGQLATSKNPYGSGGASDAIVKSLETTQLESILKKKFYNLTV